MSEDGAGGDGAGSEGPGVSYDVPKNELAAVTDTPGVRPVQEAASAGSDASDASELQGEKNELAAVTELPKPVQQVVAESSGAGDGDGDGEVSADE